MKSYPFLVMGVFDSVQGLIDPYWIYYHGSFPLHETTFLGYAPKLESDQAISYQPCVPGHVRITYKAIKTYHR